MPTTVGTESGSGAVKKRCILENTVVCYQEKDKRREHSVRCGVCKKKKRKKENPNPRRKPENFGSGRAISGDWSRWLSLVES